MRYLFLISLGALIAFVCCNCAFAISGRELTKHKIKSHLIILTIITFFLAFSYEFYEESSIDIVRHYEKIDAMRKFGWDYVVNESEYRNLFVINFFMYFVSLTPFNSLFIAIPAVIDMSIMSYIILKQMGNKSKIAMKDLLLIIISFLGLFSIKYMFSAVRSNLSVSLVSLAFYLDYIRGEKRPFAFILYFLAIFVHYYAVIMIAIRIFMIFVKNRSPYWFALVFALPFMYKFMTVIYPVGNNYIDELMALFIGYYNRFYIIGIIKNSDFTSLNSLMCFVLFAIIIFYIANERNYRFLGENGTTNNFAIVKDKEKLFLYISSILLWMLLPNRLLLERYIQFMGYGTLFYLTKNIKTISKKKKTLLLLVALYVIIWDIFVLGINYTGYNPLAGIKDKLF